MDIHNCYEEVQVGHENNLTEDILMRYRNDTTANHCCHAMKAFEENITGRKTDLVLVLMLKEKG